jgi:pimeloyl-ACP methyl ester carboxylesterase
MAAKPNLLLIPGLLCSPALWAEQVRALNDIADIGVADHTRHASLPEIAEAILAEAPPRFALAGLSMGGYIAYEIIRRAADRVTRLALLDTGARAGTPSAASSVDRACRARGSGQGATGIAAAAHPYRSAAR